MTDIRTHIFTTVTGDVTFRTLTGATALDPRFYWYYQGEARCSEAEELWAYVTYALIVNPEAPGAVESPVFSFAIWGLSLDVVESVSDRLKALFDKQVLTTVGSKKLWGKRMNEVDSYMATPQFAGKTLQFRFSWSTV